MPTGTLKSGRIILHYRSGIWITTGMEYGSLAPIRRITGELPGMPLLLGNGANREKLKFFEFFVEHEEIVKNALSMHITKNSYHIGCIITPRSPRWDHI